MLKSTHRAIPGFVLAGSVLLSGCGSGGGVKPTAQVRAVDVATNVVNTFTTPPTDTAVVTVNGGAADNLVVPYGTPTGYLYVQSGTSAFAGSTTMTIPTDTSLSTTANQTETTFIAPPTNNQLLATGSFYTGYLVGRPDVPNPPGYNLPNTTPTNLDPRFLCVVVCPDDQAAPPTGDATVRVVDGICDPEITSTNPPTLPKIDVYINGTAVPSLQQLAFDTVTPPTTTSAPLFLPQGTFPIEVKDDATGAVLIPAANTAAPTITLAAGNKYTLAISEPTAPTPSGVIPPIPPQTALTYNVTLVQD